MSYDDDEGFKIDSGSDEDEELLEPLEDNDFGLDDEDPEHDS
jgi:hypothetical protein